MIADVRQTVAAPKPNLGDVSRYDGVDGGNSGVGDETVLTDESVPLTPKIVRHEDGDEIYISYNGREFSLREFVELVQKRADGDPEALEAVIVDDLAIAAILAIAALVFSLSVTAGEIGISTERVQVTNSEEPTWYEVVGIVLLWPFMILTGDSASTNYQNVEVFDPSKT